MSNANILATVDAYIARIMEATRYVTNDADYFGLMCVLINLEDFSDWLMGIHRAY